MRWKLVCGVLLAVCVTMLAMPVLASGGTDVSGTVPLVTYDVHTSDISYNSAKVLWKTNGAATSQVFYDTQFHENVADYAYYSAIDPTLVAEHSIPLTSLSPSTTYHYRAKSVATVNGTEFIAISQDYTFATLSTYVPPSVVTVGAWPVGQTSAVLWGMLTRMGTSSSVQVYFEWGQTTDYGFETTHQNLSFPWIFYATIAPLTPGTTYHFRAVAVGNGISYYGDDKSFTALKFDTTTRVTSSANPSVWGQPVTFTATVTSSGGIPTGTVTFEDGSNTLGSGTLNSSGKATYTTTSLSVRTHSITAVYDGNSNYNGSTSPALSQKVNKANTSTMVISSLSPSVRGQSVTFTATVTATTPGSGIPTGTVTFKDGSNTLGSGMLNSSGEATYITTSLSVGTHSINAIYGGNSNYNGSTSPALSQKVNKANASTTVISSLNPSVRGQSVTFTVTVTATTPGSGTPTGTVTFKDGQTTLGTRTLNGLGVATYTTTSLSRGTHSITAVYSGDSSFNGSTSPALSQRVN
jgi:hypothetical protein